MDAIIQRLQTDFPQLVGYTQIKRGKIQGLTNADEVLELFTTLGKNRCKDFVIDDHNRGAFVNIAYWLLGDERFTALDPCTGKRTKGDFKKGFFVGGEVGTGKSLLLELLGAVTSLVQFECQGEAKTLVFTPIRTDVLCREFADKGTIDIWAKKKVLGLQDLGAEAQETLYMGNRANVLQELIEERGDLQGCFTFISSNLPLHSEGERSIKAIYGDRVHSRLKQMCNYIFLFGQDRRR